MEKRITARGIIKTESETIFLIHRIKNGKNYYVFPGGGVKKGETIEHALHREVSEETGCLLRDVQFLTTHKTEKGCGYFFTGIVSEKGKPTGKEFLNLDPNNFYELAEVKMSELASLKVKPEEIKNLILKTKTDIR